MTLGFSSETMQVRREQNKIFKVVKGKTVNPEYYAPEISFNNEDKTLFRRVKANRFQQQQAQVIRNGTESFSVIRKMILDRNTIYRKKSALEIVTPWLS